MTSVYEPLLHALSLEPRVAHPGDAVQITFRAQNLRCTASAPGIVRFLLPAGLEPSGERGLCVDLPAAPPGGEVSAHIVACLRGPIDDGTQLALQAVLEADGSRYGTNVCTLVACSRAILDGDASGVFVESIDAQSVRVRAVLTNEGDGPAYDVRLVVPAPLGTRRGDDRDATSDVAASASRFTKIDVGETVALSFDARIVAPVGVLRADDAYVEAAGMRSHPLPSRSEVVLHAALAPPAVRIAAERAALRIAVAVRNDGWADARDVRLDVTLPAALRIAAESVVVDGARLPPRPARRRTAPHPFARFEPTPAGGTIVVDRVPARATVRIDCGARASAALCGEVVVALVADGAEQTAVTAFTLEAARDVRARIVEAPRCVAPGETATLTIEVLNCGDIAETLDLTLTSEAACDATATLSVEPGQARLTTLVAQAPPHRPPDGLFRIAVACCDASGERARVETAIAVRDRSRRDQNAAFAVPHAHAVPHRRDAAACDAGTPLRAALSAPADVTAGDPFVVRATIEVDRPVDVLTLNAGAERGVRYVAGSTTIDGRGVLDRDHTSPLFGTGLRLYDVPAGTQVRLSWSLIADVVTGSPLLIGADSDADGVRAAWEPVAIVAQAGTAFAVRPAGLAYHLDARTVDPVAAPIDDLPAPPYVAAPRPTEPVEIALPLEAPVWLARLDRTRAESLERTLASQRGNMLASHVLALRAFVPDDVDAHDTAASPALGALRAALESVFERLAVKLRIPGFGVDCADLEDPAMRAALIALFALPVADIDAPRLDGVPLGAPAALRAILALTPARCDLRPPFAVALRAYAATLDAVLATFDGVALPFFEDALLRDAGTALATARTAVLAQLRDAHAPAGAA